MAVARPPRDRPAAPRSRPAGRPSPAGHRPCARCGSPGGFAITAPRPVIDAIRARPDVASVTPDATGLRPAAEPGIDLVGAPPVWSHAGAGVLAGTRGAGVTVALLDTGLDAGGPLGAAVPRRRARLARRVRPLRQPGRRRRILLRPRHRRRRGDRRRRGRCVARLRRGTRRAADRGAHLRRHLPRVGQRRPRRLPVGARPGRGPRHRRRRRPSSTPAGASPQPSCQTAFQPDLAALRAAGILVVFAAGNATVPSSPAALPEALAVGALDASGTAALPESGRGTSPCDGRTFPDLAAPGADVRTADRAGGWQTVSGTSIAAPHVTGVLALLLARHPGLLPAEQTAAVMATAHALVGARHRRRPRRRAGRVRERAARRPAIGRHPSSPPRRSRRRSPPARLP